MSGDKVIQMRTGRPGPLGLQEGGGVNMAGEDYPTIRARDFSQFHDEGGYIVCSPSPGISAPIVAIVNGSSGSSPNLNINFQAKLEGSAIEIKDFLDRLLDFILNYPDEF